MRNDLKKEDAHLDGIDTTRLIELLYDNARTPCYRTRSCGWNDGNRV